ncbi:MAG: ribulose-phosphate 3-epimerase [Christensenellaceae bacterium]|jgi:ribulose-phosphate 3-epimerase|nr:ribulose-phosphate 3-epimerase [Christensenellaceae bacterium]
MDRILIAPSILSGDFAHMGDAVRSIESWGGDLIHCDVMDGMYVNNMTFGMPMIADIKKIAKLPLDVHLMITEPERYIDRFIDAGADYLTFHPDASKCPLETLKQIRSRGVRAGIVFNPNVPFYDYAELLLDCDIVLIMSVYAGLGGQAFIPDSLKKVEQAKQYITEHQLNMPIEIDGGVNEQNAKDIINSGVSILVAGSAVFKSKDPSKTIKQLKGEA